MESSNSRGCYQRGEFLLLESHFLLLEGRINAEEAIDMVRVDIIGERGRMWNILRIKIYR